MSGGRSRRFDPVVETTPGSSGGSTGGSTADKRLRAAWLYYNRGLTQKEVADRLGISRATVIRMLEEAQRRAEVRVWISEPPGESVQLALRLEAAYGLAEARVVPGGDRVFETVGLALGAFLSERLADGMTVGVGWGRTLNAALAGFLPGPRRDMRVLSLLGGVIQPGTINPADFAWRLASATSATCHLFLAPLLVDSADTRSRLIDCCGLGRIFDLARGMDLAVISCGDPRGRDGSLASNFIDAEVRRELVAAGAIADVLCQFIDAEGRTLPHPMRDRLMAVDLDCVATARQVVVATGGAERAAALAAALRRFPGAVLITDEAAGRRLLELA